MQRKIITIVATLALITAVLFIWRTLRPISDRYDPQPLVGLGQTLAVETAKAVNGQGSVVAVITELHQKSGNPGYLEWDAFRTELKKQTGLTLIATEVIPSISDEGLHGCSSADFTEVLDRHSEVAAIVFFTSLPDWRWLQSRTTVPQSIKAKLIVRGDAPVSLKHHYADYFTSGILTTLITRRRASAPDQITKPKTPREWFHNEYQIFTPQNYELLPE